ncbi:MAG: MarR family transcriptional regulator [Lachnospiraceae bacterium]|nr:MarR family transcriptional regulator [Lachnospiraceae bacterium]
MSADFSKTLKRYNYLLGETNAAYHDASSKLGLTYSSMTVLYVVCNTGDTCPLRDICRNADISKQTVNSALRRLEADGLIYLENRDGKNKNVCLTEKGRKLSEQTVWKLIKIENEIFASWTKEDVNQYLALTERYLQDFKKRSQEL